MQPAALRFLFVSFFFVVGSAQLSGQSVQVLAKVAGRDITTADLSSEGQKLFGEKDRLVAADRSRIFSTWLAHLLIAEEAKARKVSSEKLLIETRSAVKDPEPSTIQALYDANRDALGGRPMNEVRPQIVRFLRNEAEEAEIKRLVEGLQKKFGLRLEKDINSPNLTPADVVATFAGRSITAREFETANKIELHDRKADLYEHIRDEIEVAVLNVLVEKEAAARKTDASSLIAAEITNKMRDYSDDERVDLEYAFQQSLFRKYKPQILFKEPPPLVLNVATNDDPSIGPASAAVTIVMFSDFQCPACARTHPVLKRVINEYPGKVRLVVRDFPLAGMHDRAIHAARAANAAHAQGKFVEYIELLYRNQDAFDDASLGRYAETLGLNMQKFAADVAQAATEAEIMKDVADGEAHGVSGTPTIFVNGIRVYTLSAPAFRRAIERELNSVAK